jgi:transcriptional regulator with XRE-family HTH domain
MKVDLYAARAHLGVGRRDLAALLGISPARLLSIERGRERASADIEARLTELLQQGDLIRRLNSENAPRAVGSIQWKWMHLAGNLSIMVFATMWLWASSLVPQQSIPRWILQVPGWILFVIAAFRARNAGPFCSECGVRVRPGQDQCQECGVSFEIGPHTTL